MIVMVVLAVPTGLLVLDAAWTAATNPQRQTQVIEVSAGVRDAPTHDRATATVFLNGLGLDRLVHLLRAVHGGLARLHQPVQHAAAPGREREGYDGDEDADDQSDPHHGAFVHRDLRKVSDRARRAQALWHNGSFDTTRE